MENKEEAKVVDINRYKSTVKNSPLLAGDSVSVKAYSVSLNQNTGDHVQQPPLSKESEVKKEAPTFQKQTSNQPPPPPPPQNEPVDAGFNNQYQNDNIDPMDFSGAPEPEMDEKDRKAAEAVAGGGADMLIGLYSSFVPPILADMAKANVSKIKDIFNNNSQVPSDKVKHIERFLATNNKQIEEALKLTPEQVAMLKAALSKVLEQYNFQPQNPVVNLIMVVATIAVMQYMTVSRLIKQREEELLSLIKQFEVRVPDGMESPFKKKKLFIKKEDLEKAA
jgi:hypothetical protein